LRPRSTQLDPKKTFKRGQWLSLGIMCEVVVFVVVVGGGGGGGGSGGCIL
jgi:hypothetical protein